MTIAYDADYQETLGSGTSKNMTHTGTGAQLAAIVHLFSQGSVTSGHTCTYGGTTMTKLQTQTESGTGTPVVAVLFVLGNAAAGAQTVAAAWTGNPAGGILSAATFSGCNVSSDPTRSSNGSHGRGANLHLSDSITAGGTDMSVDGMCGDFGFEALAPDAGQTEFFDTSNYLDAAGSYKVGATAMGYTAGATTQNCAHVCCALKPPAGGSQVIFAMFKEWRDLCNRIRRGLPLPEWYLRRGRVPAWAACYRSALRAF